MRFHLVSSQAKLRQSRPSFQQLAGTQAVGGLVRGRDKSRPFDYSLLREQDGFRSLASNAARCAKSCSVTAVNFNPSPLPGSECRTTASALICPSCTRKSSLAFIPTGRGVGVSMNIPPELRSRRRETSSTPLQRQ